MGPHNRAFPVHIRAVDLYSVGNWRPLNRGVDFFFLTFLETWKMECRGRNKVWLPFPPALQTVAEADTSVTNFKLNFKKEGRKTRGRRVGVRAADEKGKYAHFRARAEVQGCLPGPQARQCATNPGPVLEDDGTGRRRGRAAHLLLLSAQPVPSCLVRMLQL